MSATRSWQFVPRPLISALGVGIMLAGVRSFLESNTTEATTVDWLGDSYILSSSSRHCQSESEYFLCQLYGLVYYWEELMSVVHGE